MADYTPAVGEHFFSPETALSLELPAGQWRMEGGTAGEVSFVAHRGGDDTAGRPPRIDCRLVEIPGNPPDAYRHLARELASAAGVDAPTGVDTDVDGHRAVSTTVSTSLDGVGPIVQSQTLAQVGHVVLSIVATAEQRDADRFQPVFTSAVDSIRIIPRGAS